jgi:hypothetical protein
MDARGPGAGREVERISVEEARRDTAMGGALLVCAYDDEAKCRAMRLEDALTLHDWQQRLAGAPRDRELIFYCG